jgi:hypothetical protein
MNTTRVGCKFCHNMHDIRNVKSGCKLGKHEAPQCFKIREKFIFYCDIKKKFQMWIGFSKSVYWCGILKTKTFGNLANIQSMPNPQFMLFSSSKDVESHIHICIVCGHLKFFLHLIDHVIFMCGAFFTTYQPIINKDGSN